MLLRKPLLYEGNGISEFLNMEKNKFLSEVNQAFCKHTYFSIRTFIYNFIEKFLTSSFSESTSLASKVFIYHDATHMLFIRINRYISRSAA